MYKLRSFSAFDPKQDSDRSTQIEQHSLIEIQAMALMYSWVLVMTCAALLNIGHAADPDPLQDFCVADLKSKVSVKPRSEVTAKDFTYTGLRNPGKLATPSDTCMLHSGVFDKPAVIRTFIF